METKQLILLGPPGVGVSAQAKGLAERWQVPHISMAELLDRAIAQGTEIGSEARPYLEAGELVPDALVMKLIRRRLEQPDAMLEGWVLEGFPRTLAQAVAFDQWWTGFGQSAATVAYLKGMPGLLISRLALGEGKGESPGAIRRRLDSHQEEVAPLLEYYGQRSQLQTLNGNLSFAELARDLAQLGDEYPGAARFIPDEAELDSLIAQEPRLVVDCMASWCGSCKQVAPLIDRLAETYGDRLTVMKMDFDANRQISKRFRLQGIPAVMFFKEGELLEILVGVKSYAEYSAAVTRLFEA
ncbi:adenylate kinase [filamentous cyanobacterium CCP5]|nr:adenylate kinase [filamentous cyanobacterium CCP5]